MAWRRALSSPLPACGERPKFAGSEFRVRGSLREFEFAEKALSQRKSGARGLTSRVDPD
jgi:hypothetical protein